MIRLIGYIYKSNAKAASEKKLLQQNVLNLFLYTSTPKLYKSRIFPCPYINYK